MKDRFETFTILIAKISRNIRKIKEAGKRIADKIEVVLEEISIGLTEEERISFYRSLSIISNGLETICNRHGEKESR